MSLYHNAEMIRGLVMKLHDKVLDTNELVPDDISAIRNLLFEADRLQVLLDDLTDNSKGAA